MTNRCRIYARKSDAKTLETIPKWIPRGSLNIVGDALGGGEPACADLGDLRLMPLNLITLATLAACGESRTNRNGGLGRPRARFMRFWEAFASKAF